MKKFLIVLAASVFFSSGSFSQVSHVSRISQVIQPKKFQNMVGSWEIIGEQDSGGGLEIIDSATILIRFMGEEKNCWSTKLIFQNPLTGSTLQPKTALPSVILKAF
jgi:hypothetical protein